MKQKISKFIPCFLLLSLFVLGQCSRFHESHGNIKPHITQDPINFGNPDQIEDFNPVGNGTTPFNPGEADSAEEQPCLVSNTSVSPMVIHFSNNEVGQTECQSVSVVACTDFTVEINTPEGSEEAPAFSVADQKKNGFKICFQPTQVGSQSGRAHVVVGTDTPQVFVITLSGQAVDSAFQSIDQPVENQLVWEHDGESRFDGTLFHLPVSGRLNSDLDSFYVRPRSVTAAVSGNATEIAAGDDLTFSGSVAIPLPGAVYPIEFSVKTTQETTLRKTVNVIRYVRPEGRLEVRDPNGEIANVTDTHQNDTDGISLTTGVVITNLPFSAPNAEVPLTIEFRMTSPTAEEFVFANSEWKNTGAPDTLEYSVATEPGESVGDNGKCSTGFPENSYCVPLPQTSSLHKGIYHIVATVHSRHTDNDPEGSVTFSADVVVDNDIPRITVTTPHENFVYALNKAITLKGTVENYAAPTTENPCAVKLWINAPATKNDGTVALANTIPGFCPTVLNAATDGAIDPLNSGNRGNIKKGTFEFQIPQNRLHLYTNLIQIRAYDTNGRSAIKVVTFERGEYNPSSFRSGSGFSFLTGTLTSGQLGNVSHGQVKRPPLMLDLSEAKLKSPEVLAVIKKQLNDNLNFADLMMGGGLKKDDNDHIKPIGTGTGALASNAEITRMLHGTAPEQVRALLDYQRKHNSSTAYFDTGTAQDMCGQPITTAVITPNVYQYLFPEWDPSWLWDPDIGLREWPGVCDHNKDCNTTEQGVWNIDFDLKDNGFIDVNLSLEGVGGAPAFWGHFTAYNLIQEGTTGAYGPTGGLGIADPVIPLLMNVGRMEISLKDMIRIYKVQKDENGVKMCSDPATGDPEPCACGSSNNCTNMLYIYPNRIQESTTAFKFEAYRGCKEYFQSKYPGQNLPYGCDPSRNQYFPFLIDTTSPQGYLLWETVGDRGANTTLLNMVRSVFKRTFKNIFTCLPTQVINPIIDPDTFPYPTWTSEDDKIKDLTMAVEKKDDKVSIKLLKDATNPLFTLKPNIRDADITLNQSKLGLKLPLEIGTTGITRMFSVFGNDFYTRFFGAIPRNWGYIYRNPQSNFESHDRLDQNPKPDLNVSLGLEEIANAVTHILWEKGPLILLDLFASDTYKKLGITNNWKLGIDKVILGKLDICDISNKLASPDLPPNFLFQGDGIDIKQLFGDTLATHLDITLDKNSPPTLEINPIQLFREETPHADGETAAQASARQVGTNSVPVQENSDSNAFAITLGLTNVRLDVKKLDSDPDTGNYINPSNEEPVISIRLDALIKLFASYDRDTRKIKITIPQLDQMAIYASILKNGGVFNDEALLAQLYGKILSVVFSKIGTNYPNQTPTLDISLPNLVSAFNDFQSAKINESNIHALDDFENKAVLMRSYQSLDPNTGCSGNPPHYVGEDMITPEMFHLISVMQIERRRGRRIFTFTPKTAENCIGEKVGVNKIVDNLCDLGLSDIEFSYGFPNLIPDVDNGYLHLSTDLLLHTTDELWEEVDTE